MRVEFILKVVISLMGLALATQPLAAEPIQHSEQEDYGGTCLVIYAGALGGNMEAQDAEKIKGTISIVAYFVGKLRGRHPDMKIADFITPQFAIRAVNADGQQRKNAWSKLKKCEVI